MVEVGDTAPNFALPLATGDDIQEFTLSERLDEAPIVLAFYPGAFTSVCTTEMCTFRDRMTDFEDVNATVYGISPDSPFSLNEFHSQNNLNFGLLSDTEKKVIGSYDVAMSFSWAGHYTTAKRAVFVINREGEIGYKWVTDNPGNEPNYQEVQKAVA